jgi:hypothetical protein
MYNIIWLMTSHIIIILFVLIKPINIQQGRAGAMATDQVKSNRRDNETQTQPNTEVTR